jgi:hypothetical protein
MNQALAPEAYVVPRSTLARAAIGALAGATIILTLFVLPAEFGIDPTGVGKALGLTRMSEQADPVDESGTTPPQGSASAGFAVPPQTQASIQKATAYRSDEKTITLAPHTGMEVKAVMKAGDSFQFRWTATGPVRADMHGEPLGAKDDEFSDYWKQKDLSSGQGAFTAPFAGTHGWYWKNRGEVPVTITVKLDGFYERAFERS